MFDFLKKTKKEPENLKEILDYLKNLKQEIERISQELEIFKKQSKLSVQKIGIVRYNPFIESGGDQSFSIALLNSNDDGLVITSLYGREGNRVYAKPIKNGQSEYLLSEEERKAIRQAINMENAKFQTPNKLQNDRNKI